MAKEIDEIEWLLSIKPLITASYANENIQHVNYVVDAILKCGSTFFEHDKDFEQFYSTFAVLSAHHLCGALPTVSKNDLHSVLQACQVLIKFFLAYLRNLPANCPVQKLSIVTVLKGLCTGKSTLSKQEQLAFASILRQATAPKYVSTRGDEQDVALVSAELTRPRLDTHKDIFSQLTNVFDDLYLPGQKLRVQQWPPTPGHQWPPTPVRAVDGDSEGDQKNDSQAKIAATFANRNRQLIRCVQGCEAVLNVCFELPFFKRYSEMLRQGVASNGLFDFPNDMTQAIAYRTSLLRLEDDLASVSQITSLMTLDPSSPSCVELLAEIGCCCLLVAINAASTSVIASLGGSQSKSGLQASKEREEEVDQLYRRTTEKALRVWRLVLSASQQHYTDPQCTLNLHMRGCWVVMSGVRHILALHPSTLLSRGEGQRAGRQLQQQATKITSFKCAYIDVVMAALTDILIHSLSVLLDDVNVYTSMISLEEAIFDWNDILPAAIGQLTQHYEAPCRLKFLTNHLDILRILFTSITLLTKKAIVLKKAQSPDQVDIHVSGDDDSESNTYYEDDFSSTGASASEDEDSDHILGQWLEATLASDRTTPPTGEQVDTPSVPGTMHTDLSDLPGPGLIIQDKKDPQPFAVAVVNALLLLNNQWLPSPCQSLQQYTRSSLSEHVLAAVAWVVRDVEREGSSVSSLLDEISQQLASLTHNLLGYMVIGNQFGCSETEGLLLSQLGVHPAVSSPWPLAIGSRTLAILAEVVLRHQQQERLGGCGRESSAVYSENLCKWLWTKSLDRLRAVATEVAPNTSCKDIDDLNMEHAQLLVFLFHSLPLAMRKYILHQLCDVIMHVADFYTHTGFLFPGATELHNLYTSVPLPATRLLVMLDYFLYYFYDPPAPLFNQVKWNLFECYSSSKRSDNKKRGYFCKELSQPEQKHQKELMNQPVFYNLGPTERSSQEAPKVDGLCCSYLLANPEKLEYPKLYEAVVTIASIGTKIPLEEDILACACVHYHWVVSSRLLSSLPLSVPYLQRLHSSALTHTGLGIVHDLRWSSRLSTKVYQAWIKDGLMKQGLAMWEADYMVSQVVTEVSDTKINIEIFQSFLQGQVNEVKEAVGRGSGVKDEEVLSLPDHIDILALEVVLGKLHVYLDDLFTAAMGDPDPHLRMADAKKLMAPLLQLVQIYIHYSNLCVLWTVPDSEWRAITPRDVLTCQQACLTMLSLAGGRVSRLSGLAKGMIKNLPTPVEKALDKWNQQQITDYPNTGAWRNAFASDLSPAESYVDAILQAHFSAVVNQSPYTLAGPIKHALQSIIRLILDLVLWCPDAPEIEKLPAVVPDVPELTTSQVLFPLMFNATTEYMFDTLLVSNLLPGEDDAVHQLHTYHLAIAQVYDLLMCHCEEFRRACQPALYECLAFLELSLDKPAAKPVLQTFFASQGDLVKLLMSATTSELSPMYGTKVLRVFNKLFQLVEKFPNDQCYISLCTRLGSVAQLDSTMLYSWLGKLLYAPAQQGDSDQVTERMRENRLLLHSITSYLVKDSTPLGEQVAQAILQALVQLSSVLLSPDNDDVAGFPEVMSVMVTLAGAGSGVGHAVLVQMSIKWLEVCKTYLSQKDVLDKICEGEMVGRHQAILGVTCTILAYLGDIVGALQLQAPKQSALPTSPLQTDPPAEGVEWDWVEELAGEEEEDVVDSEGDESDEESLDSKLCTYTLTQKDFMNQHWYHCHTCSMVEGVGVCTVCAKVCHRDHDLSYAKFGSFFCDCGAKEDGTCIAMTKRTGRACAALPVPILDSASGTSPFAVENLLSGLARPRASEPGHDPRTPTDKDRVSAKNRELMARQIQECGDELLAVLSTSPTVPHILDLLRSLLPGIRDNYLKISPAGSLGRAREALNNLKTVSKGPPPELVDNLMGATMGTQDGALENVRLTLTGDQGQQIRHLLGSHALHRIGMCALSAPNGRRHTLAVSQDKGKVVILQLGALLKHSDDNSKRKLTLTRLLSIPMPFTVISLASNPCNEEYLAVCGLKDCHVLTVSSTGVVAEHLVLHPALTSGNFILKSVWLPGSQTELAVVTPDFVKIYDLALDANNPKHHFNVINTKVKDVTFICQRNKRFIVMAGSSGYVYVQELDHSSSADFGPFYVTNTFEVKHTDLKDENGIVASGCVSAYYSHTLQLLFFSYANGKTFCTPISVDDVGSVTKLFDLSFKPANGAKGGNQPLVRWVEIANHPGLVSALVQGTNTPVVWNIVPDKFLVQELKIQTSKHKVQDIVMVRPMGQADPRTILLVLSEDGSLRVFVAATGPGTVNYWLQPSLSPRPVLTSVKPPAHAQQRKKAQRTGASSSSISFPVDFFEHCSPTTEVEFGGPDLLQVYNTQQLKNRLATNGLFVVSNRPGGFDLELTNLAQHSVLAGIRLQVAATNLERAPSMFDVFGRTVHFNVVGPRWVDIPFTKEESLLANKKVTIHIHPSRDPAHFTAVDSVKVYLKSKESVGWSEETEDVTDTSTITRGAEASASNTTVASTGTSVDEEATVATPAPTQVPVTDIDKLLVSSLEVLQGCFSGPSLLSMEEQKDWHNLALQLSTQLLTLPTPALVSGNIRTLLQFMFSDRATYHAHIDQAVLTSVRNSLIQFSDCPASSLDPEAFQRLLVVTRTIANCRPLNLVKCTSPGTTESSSSTPHSHFLEHLLEIFWKLHDDRPSHGFLAPACQPGLCQLESTVQFLAEIILAYCVADPEVLPLGADLLASLLLSQDTLISYSCKQALVRMLRSRPRKKRVHIASPPLCSTPGVGVLEEEDEEDEEDEPSTPAQGTPRVMGVDEPDDQPDQYEGMEIGDDPGGLNDPGAAEFLEGALMNLPGDDEAMVELAIALSLQEQGPPENRQQQHHSSLGIGLGASHSAQMSGQYSASASGPDSDDEGGSNIATAGSHLRASPAHLGSGHESEGSNTDSISISGRSSSVGDTLSQDRSATLGRSEDSVSVAPVSSEAIAEAQEEECSEGPNRLHGLRLHLLERLCCHLSAGAQAGGLRAVPLLQVLMMLTTDLEASEERDKAVLDHLLTVLIGQLKLERPDVSDIITRSAQSEVQLVLLRALCILMTKTRTSSTNEGISAFVSLMTTTALVESGGLEFCARVLQGLLEYWRNSAKRVQAAVLNGQLLKPRLSPSAPDMAPFFLRQYVKTHSHDLFGEYSLLLTEILLRLPYQIKKVCESSNEAVAVTFNNTWFDLLAEFMMLQPAPYARRQVRKLLLYICGSRERYRQLRDTHTLDTHLHTVHKIILRGHTEEVAQGGASHTILPYDVLTKMVESVRFIAEVATGRTRNWQLYCAQHQDTLGGLLEAAYCLDPALTPSLLGLVQSAICLPLDEEKAETKLRAPKKSSSRVNKEDDDTTSQMADEGLSSQLVQILLKTVSGESLQTYTRTFLLASNSTAMRWQAHRILLQCFSSCDAVQREWLVSMCWNLWPHLASYGNKATQFVDLLGYFCLKSSQNEDQWQLYAQRAMALLTAQNKSIAVHPNVTVYRMLQGLVELDGYYLESAPCLVCNNPEVPYSTMKLANVKVDSKFTTSTQIIKLVGSHMMSRVTLRLTDVKRSKMIRTLNLYYSNRTVQAVIELKNKPALWHKAKQVTLTPGQTELKIDLPLPVVACNLMIEYADFYDNLSAATETLQCPRCSANVPANPGVCSNCGENVFQCHKCRAINYDEKDPFLCNSCGFCKYAKFDITMYAKPCCAVDPIESDDDRSKTITTINTLLDKADRLYKTIQQNKPSLEALLGHISENTALAKDELTGSPSVTNSTGSVNKLIEQLGLKYSKDCKNAFDELSKIIQKIVASRQELLHYDQHQRDLAAAAVKVIPIYSAPPPESWPSQGSTDLTPTPTHELATARPGPARSGDITTSGRSVQCFSCAQATIRHCVTLLQALASNRNIKKSLCQQGLLRELVTCNLRQMPTTVGKTSVRSLLCVLTLWDEQATAELNALLLGRVRLAIENVQGTPNLASSVRHEMLLLGDIVRLNDVHWEARIKTALRLFLLTLTDQSPDVLEYIGLPCLQILYQVLKETEQLLVPLKEKAAASGKGALAYPSISATDFLQDSSGATFSAWKDRTGAVQLKSSVSDSVVHRDKDTDQRLASKYASKWKQHMTTVRNASGEVVATLQEFPWLRSVLFSSSQSARQMACSMVRAMWQIPSRKKTILNMLTQFLGDINGSGENAADFVNLLIELMTQEHWRFYLVIRGVLARIEHLINQEIDWLSSYEDSSFNCDLSLGFALKCLVDLLQAFIDVPEIIRHYKRRLVGSVLSGFLALKRLFLQRTKLIDETQEKLQAMTDTLTTGTEEETRQFLSVCVVTVNKYPLTDQLSPTFIFERLCNIIKPEENAVGEFFLSLEKDPQQEDFLQGRMLGNPYSSNQPGLGPLMRDVKNKICTDCELVALLDDDTGMELLVCNKIISLDLPVADVYKKIWVPERGEESMRVVYRMRGLLGDATEDMINTLDSGKDESENAEEVYKLAGELATNGGLRAMLRRLSAIRDMVSGRQLLVILLKLFRHCVKVRVNRQKLIEAQMNTVGVMLGALNLALLHEQEGGVSTVGQTLTEEVLSIMEVILQEASGQEPHKYKEFTRQCGDRDQLLMLLDRINSPFVRANASVLQALMRLIPFLTFGDQDKMQALVDHFLKYLDFNRYDRYHSEDEQLHLECFCNITNGIETNANGAMLKDIVVKNNIVRNAIESIKKHCPEQKSLSSADSENWKDFLCRPSLPFVLRMLTGLCKGYQPIQRMVSDELIPVLHSLEQASSQGNIGSLAENLMEAMRENATIAQQIEDVRLQTKAEKKRLAMAMRQKQLTALKMTTNEKGQVTVKSSMLEKISGDLTEEHGLVCCICREGYRNQPTKVLGIYTFTKKQALDEFEAKPRKAQGYSTVSHFNVVHVDCHNAAVKSSPRVRDEWDSATLQNANTRCNGLLPLWGPNVNEPAFSSTLARHNSYLQECTNVRDIGYTYTLHDLKHLLLRFAHETSFSVDSGGGGRQSNMHLVPYILQLALYVIHTTRMVAREEKNLNTFVTAAVDKWVENSFETDGPLYYSVLALAVWNRDRWTTNRTTLLKRLLVLAQARKTSASNTNRLSDKVLKEYSVYKPFLLFFGLVDGIYRILFKKCPGNVDDWSKYLMEYIRSNDQTLSETSDKLVAFYEDEMLPCESLAEALDVLGLMADITDADEFVSNSLKLVP